MLTVGAHEHEHPQIPIFSHERLKSIFFATECSWWALMAKYQDFRVLMLMGAHREHPRSPLILIGILCLISHSLSQALASIENFALALLFFFFLDFRWRLVWGTNYELSYSIKVSLRNIN